MNAFLGFPAILAFAPHACGIPRFAIVLYYLYRHAPDTGNTKSIVCAPRPPRGTGGARGGLHKFKNRFSTKQ